MFESREHSRASRNSKMSRFDSTSSSRKQSSSRQKIQNPLDSDHARSSLKKILNRFPLQNSALIEAKRKELTSKSREKNHRSGRKLGISKLDKSKRRKKSTVKSRVRKSKIKKSQEGHHLKTLDSPSFEDKGRVKKKKHLKISTSRLANLSNLQSLLDSQAISSSSKKRLKKCRSPKRTNLGLSMSKTSERKLKKSKRLAKSKSKSSRKIKKLEPNIKTLDYLKLNSLVTKTMGAQTRKSTKKMRASKGPKKSSNRKIRRSRKVRTSNYSSARTDSEFESSQGNLSMVSGTASTISRNPVDYGRLKIENRLLRDTLKRSLIALSKSNMNNKVSLFLKLRSFNPGSWTKSSTKCQIQETPSPRLRPDRTTLPRT